MNKQTPAIHSRTTQLEPPWRLTPPWAGLIALALVGSASMTAPAQALNVNFSYAPGVTLNQALGFEMAGKVWENTLADNATVNLYIEATDNLPDNVIAGALPGLVAKSPYGDYVKKLDADKTTANDNQAVASLKKMGNSYDAIAIPFEM